ncbi:hypothetical protein SDC9_66853 [bioreactor metagenome]|uniref:Uncharacterized protein n=1 Tax=bioreactor metagenome TaxID=1076179 RepID=A0A644Y1L6_9ZZZZ
MAWLSLALVVLIFFIPGIDLCQLITANNINIPLTFGDLAIAIPIPFTGPLKLFLIIGIIWILIWSCFYYLTFFVERLKMPMQKFFVELLAPTHPKICLMAPVYLAKITIGLTIIKVFFYLISVFFTDVLLPILVKATFSQNSLFQWLINSIMSVSNSINQFNSPWILSAFVLSLFILIVSRVSNWERKKLIRQYVGMIHTNNKKHQTKIVIPAEQL